MSLPTSTHPFLITGNDANQYKIANSLRFRASNSAYLSRTPGSAGNRKTFTISYWMKRGALGGPQYIFGAGSGTTEATWFANAIDTATASDQIGSSSWTTGGGFTNASLRDPSAWYHIVIAIDTTQATQSNRSKLYINGVLQTYTGSVALSLNADLAWNNSGVVHYIGARIDSGPRMYFDGYLSEIYNIDGQALTPSAFGYTDNLTNQWVPKQYTGTYGTNGFYLPFSDNTTETNVSSGNIGLGSDFSGNGNYWTTNGLSLSGSTVTSFTSTGTTSWTAPAGVTSVRYLVIAGGGGGALGGGGAGGFQEGILSVIPGNSYTVTVGAGGSGAYSLNGTATSGGNSVFASITSIGGGYGGNAYNGAGSGGSGGGNGNGSGAVGSGTPGQGFSGSNSYGVSWSTGGGGGGAGAAASQSGTSGGNGGIGLTSSITGVNTYYAGGGGGGGDARGGSNGSGGSGGGGNGSTGGGGSGTANRGGGGGGGGYNGSSWTNGGAGGSGIVILSYGAGLSFDSMIDSPTAYDDGSNIYNRGNYPTLRILRPAVSGHTYSNGNLRFSSNNSGSYTILADGQFPSTGKYYFEIKFSAINAAGYYAIVGVGNKSYTSDGVTGGASWNTTNTIGIAIDCDNSTFQGYKDGVAQTLQTGATVQNSEPYFSIIGSTSTFAFDVNFGQRPFSYTPPAGFKALNSFNLPNPSLPLV